MDAPYREIRERECRDVLGAGGWRIEWVKRPEREDHDEDDYRAWKAASGRDCDYDDEDNI